MGGKIERTARVSLYPMADTIGKFKIRFVWWSLFPAWGVSLAIIFRLRSAEVQGWKKD